MAIFYKAVTSLKRTLLYSPESTHVREFTVASFSDCQLSISISCSNIPPVKAGTCQRKPQKGNHIENDYPGLVESLCMNLHKTIALSTAKKGRHPPNASGSRVAPPFSRTKQCQREVFPIYKDEKASTSYHFNNQV